MTALQKARFAVFAYFGLAGSALTFWAVHIPYVENKLDIPHSTIGTLLLVFGAGALTAMQLIGPIIDRVGSRTATFIASMVLGVSMFLPGLANSVWTLALALFLLGLGIGSTDVGVNSHALEVEKAYGRPIFSAFHAMWSIGGLIGASLGGLALSIGMPMLTTMSLAAVSALAIGAWMRTWMLPDSPNHEKIKHTDPIDKQAQKLQIKTSNRQNRKVLGYVIFLGAMAGAAAIAEGTGVDWSALHHTSILQTSEATASIALAVYTGSMGITRLVIDKLVAIRGRIFVIRYGSLVSAVGTLVVVLSDSSFIALLGWVIAGVGIAGVVPQIFAYSGALGEESHAGRNMAKVVGISYAGILAGPAIIGFLTEFVPLNLAIGFGILLGVFTAAGSVIINRKSKVHAKAI
jgi:MFS family permease